MDEHAQQEVGTPHELSTFEKLRLGHGLLTERQFHAAIVSGEMEAWSIGPRCYVLVGWGESKYGRTLNILTAVGMMTRADECMETIERYARSKGARAIMSVGRIGWTSIAKHHGYAVEPCMLMKKVL